jgi:hypothetical protein
MFFVALVGPAAAVPYHDFPENDPAHLHDFRSVSFSPDGKNMLLVVCGEAAADECSVSQLELATGKRTRFRFHDAYVYRSASYTPDERAILLTRVKAGPDVQQSLNHSEIVLINRDSTTLRVLPTGDGYKAWPVMSADGKHVAFWKGELRTGPAKSLGHNYDLWELSLDDAAVRPFGSSYRFFGFGPLQYVGADELLVNAEAPMAVIDQHNVMAALGNYGKRTGHSKVYRIKRNDSSPVSPLAFGLDYADQASADANGTTNVFGFDHGMVLVSQDGNAHTIRHEVPTTTIRGLMLAASSPDGRNVAFVYATDMAPAAAERKLALGIFEVRNSRWRSLDLPELSATASVDVH